MPTHDQPANPGAVDAAEAADDLESLSDDQLLKMLEESRIVIKKGGEVIIENLTPGLLEVALELNPDQPSIQCRVGSADDADDADDTGGADDADDADDAASDAAPPATPHATRHHACARQ